MSRISSLLLVVVGLTVQNAGGAASPPAQAAPRVINITAERFAFTPSQIVLEAGEEAELRLKSDDTVHGFRIAGTPISVLIPKRGRKELSVRLKAPAPGRYTFECTRLCGAGHNFMRGELIVRQPAATP